MNTYSVSRDVGLTLKLPTGVEVTTAVPECREPDFTPNLLRASAQPGLNGPDSARARVCVPLGTARAMAIVRSQLKGAVRAASEALNLTVSDARTAVLFAHEKAYLEKEQGNGLLPYINQNAYQCALNRSNRVFAKKLEGAEELYWVAMEDAGEACTNALAQIRQRH